VKRDDVLLFIKNIGEPLQNFFPARSEYILWRTQHPERLEKVDFEQLPDVVEVNPIISASSRRPKRQLPIMQLEESLSPTVVGSLIPVQRDLSTVSAISVEKDSSAENNEEILNRVYKIVEYIRGLDLNSIFLEPVNEEYAPQYYSIITHPMDLQTIMRKGEASMYASIQEVCEDVDLMLRNCLLYNNPDDWIYKVSRLNFLISIIYFFGINLCTICVLQYYRRALTLKVNGKDGRKVCFLLVQQLVE
jgi:hypothetical protein